VINNLKGRSWCGTAQLYSHYLRVQENQESEASLGYMRSSCLENKQKKKTEGDVYFGSWFLRLQAMGK
jgi:hypothetical protein